jgi:hypothetical protein
MKLALAAAGFALLIGPGTAQDTTPDEEVTTAVEEAAKNGFSYVLKPAAEMPSFNRGAVALAGTAIKGEFAGGIGHATDGTFEIYRRGDKIAVKAERGWLNLEQFTSPLRTAASEAFDLKDGRLWRRGNVTQARKALDQLIQLDHLLHRSQLERLTNVPTAFADLDRVKKGEAYEGYLNDSAAFNLMQGPFDEMVKRGNLAFQGVTGFGRVTLDKGSLKKINAKATGKFAFYNDEDNVKRKGLCTIEIVAEFSKIGETKIEVPKEAEALLSK